MTSDAPEGVGLFVFRPEQSEEVVRALGYTTTKSGRILDSLGKRKKFYCCGKDAKVERLGRVMPGSLELICDDPICFNRYAVTLVSK
jgi:hypothetical protein